MQHHVLLYDLTFKQHDQNALRLLVRREGHLEGQVLYENADLS